MPFAIFLIIIGVALLYFGAEWLIRGATGIGRQLGMESLLIGLTIVAFGTSAPELVVSIAAALRGSGDIALGNVIGSNICNIGLILAVAALIRPVSVQRQLVKFDMPLVVVLSVILLIFMWNGVLARWQAGLFAVGLVSYILLSIRLAKKSGAAVEGELEEALANAPAKPWLAIVLVVVGIVVLVGGASLFVDGAVRLATMLNVSEAVIGLTVVAIGTSLPELATSVVAALKKESDIAVGNVVGSNIFNILCILGISGLVTPLRATDVGPSDFGVMIAFAVVFWVFSAMGFRIGRAKGGVLLAAYAGYLIWISSQAA